VWLESQGVGLRWWKVYGIHDRLSTLPVLSHLSDSGVYQPENPDGMMVVFHDEADLRFGYWRRAKISMAWPQPRGELKQVVLLFAMLQLAKVQVHLRR